MTSSKLTFAKALAVVAAASAPSASNAADVYAIRLCEQFQQGDQVGATASLEALERIGIDAVALNEQAFSVGYLLSVVRDRHPADLSIRTAISSLERVTLLQGGYMHDAQVCVDWGDLPASVESFLVGAPEGATSLGATSFPKGSEG